MILVTGGTGQTGRALVQLLQQGGQTFRVLSRNAARAQQSLGADVNVVQGDLNDADSLGAAFDAVERLFLLSTPDPAQVEQEGRAQEAAEAAGVRKVVKLSVLGASEDSPVSFGRWHAFSERQLLESDLDVTILRPHYFMQNTLNLVPQIAASGGFGVPMRDAAIGMIDVRDIAAVAYETLLQDGHAGRTYDLTGGEALTMTQVAAVLSQHMGRPVQYFDISPKDAETAMLDAGLPSWLTDALVTLYGIFAAGHASECTHAVQDITGRPPRTFATFVSDHADAFKME